MKIALVSQRFAPDIGGIQTMSQLLAREFARNGHDVLVLTRSKTTGDDTEFPFQVLRAPRAIDLWRATRDADVVFHNNIVLRFAWPLIFLRRPWVVAVRTWIRRNNGSVAFRDRLKLWLLRRAFVISISRAVAAHLSVPSTVIPNSYRDDLFRLHPEVTRTPGSLVFAGRLVNSKGVHVLLGAMAELVRRGITPHLTIIGDGPQRLTLEELSKNLQLAASVKFLGARTGEDLARELNRASVMVVPSLWDEPFGVIALEGIACGCVIVATDGGGLPDAVGSCGILVPNGDESALADAIQELLSRPERIESLLDGRATHLADHTAEVMGEKYLNVLEHAYERSGWKESRRNTM